MNNNLNININSFFTAQELLFNPIVEYQYDIEISISTFTSLMTRPPCPLNL